MPQYNCPPLSTLVKEIAGALSASLPRDSAITVACSVESCPDVSRAPFALGVAQLGQLVHMVPDSVPAVDACRTVIAGRLVATIEGFHIVSDSKPCEVLKISAELTDFSTLRESLCTYFENKLGRNWEMLCLDTPIVTNGNGDEAIENSTPASNFGSSPAASRSCVRLLRGCKSENCAKTAQNKSAEKKKPSRINVLLAPISRRIVSGTTRQSHSPCPPVNGRLVPLATTASSPTSCKDEKAKKKKIIKRTVKQPPSLSSVSTVSGTAAVGTKDILLSLTMPNGTSKSNGFLEKAIVNEDSVGKIFASFNNVGSEKFTSTTIFTPNITVTAANVSNEKQLTPTKYNGIVENVANTVKKKQFKNTITSSADSSVTSRSGSNLDSIRNGHSNNGLIALTNGLSKTDENGMMDCEKEGAEDVVLTLKINGDKEPLKIMASTSILNHELESEENRMASMRSSASYELKKLSVGRRASYEPENALLGSTSTNCGLKKISLGPTLDQTLQTNLSEAKKNSMEMGEESGTFSLSTRSAKIMRSYQKNGQKCDAPAGRTTRSLPPLPAATGVVAQRLSRHARSRVVLSPISGGSVTSCSLTEEDEDEDLLRTTDDDETLLLKSSATAPGDGGDDSGNGASRRRVDDDEDYSEALGDLSLREENFSFVTNKSEIFAKTFLWPRALSASNSSPCPSPRDGTSVNSSSSTLKAARFESHMDALKGHTEINSSNEMVRGMMNQMPVVVLQQVLTHFSYHELCDLRRVHPHWDELCGQMLNSAYYQLIHIADRLLTDCQRRIYAEKCLSKPIQVLTNLQVYVINPVDVLRAAIDEGVVCFPYGLILDKAFELIDRIEFVIRQNEQVNEALLNWERLAELARRAQVHYRRIMQPEAERRMAEVYKLSATQRLQRIDSFLVEASVMKLEKNTEKTKDDLCWELQQLKEQNKQLKKDNRELKQSCLKLDARVDAIERKFKTMARLLQ